MQIVTLNCYSQNWESLGGGSSGGAVRGLFVDSLNNRIYATGSFTSIGGVSAHRVAYWENSVWTSLCSPPAWLDGNAILTPLIYNGDLYVSGTQLYMQDSITGSLAHFVGGEWEPFGSPDGVTYLEELGGSLFAYGAFSTIDNKSIKNISVFNGIGWEPFGDSSVFNSLNVYSVQDIELYNGNYILGGNFNSTPYKEVMQWNGSNWSSLNNGIPGNWSSVNCLKSFNGILYIGGSFDEIGFGKSLTAWDGQQFFEPFPTLDWVQVYDLEIINEELYIVGSVGFKSDSSTLYGIAKYDGDSICMFGGVGYNWESINANSIAGLNGEIYVTAGSTMLMDTVNSIAKWVGTTMDSCVYNPNYVGIDELTIDHQNKSIIKILDLMGRESEDRPNTILIYLYSDGTTEKIFRTE